MYGYYRSGQMVDGVREILVVHLIRRNNNPMCGLPRSLAPTNVTFGKHVCKACKKARDNKETRQKRQAYKEKMANFIEYTATMF
jgi:hypothetical protein